MSTSNVAPTAEATTQPPMGLEPSPRGTGTEGGGAAGCGGCDGGVISAVVMLTVVQLLVFTSVSVRFATNNSATAPLMLVEFSTNRATIFVYDRFAHGS